MAEKSYPPALRVVGDSANLAAVRLPTLITLIASLKTIVIRTMRLRFAHKESICIFRRIENG
jgi:hypothetical protein